MCRLIYMPPNCDVKRKVLVKLYTWLVKRGGGDGNGVGAVWSRPDRQTLVYKGLKIPPSKVANMAYSWNEQGAHVVLHTRHATSGHRSDENCQPFKARNTLIAQNGVWVEGCGIAAVYNQGDSDTGAFARMWRQKGLRYIKRADLYPPSGVWLLIGRRKQVVIVPESWFTVEFDRNTGIWASEFPWNQEQWDSFEVASGEYTLADGAKPERRSWLTKYKTTQPTRTVGYLGGNYANSSVTNDGNTRAMKTTKFLAECAADDAEIRDRLADAQQGIDDDMDAPNKIGGA